MSEENDRFEAFAKKFEGEFGYYPLGKDTYHRPPAETILMDLAKCYEEVGRLREDLDSLRNKGRLLMNKLSHDEFPFIQEGLEFLGELVRLEPVDPYEDK